MAVTRLRAGGALQPLELFRAAFIPIIPALAVIPTYGTSVKTATHFNQSPLRYRKMRFNREIAARLQSRNKHENYQQDFRGELKCSKFKLWDLSSYTSNEEAYHQLMLELVRE